MAKSSSSASSGTFGTTSSCTMPWPRSALWQRVRATFTETSIASRSKSPGVTARWPVRSVSGAAHLGLLDGLTVDAARGVAGVADAAHVLDVAPHGGQGVVPTLPLDPPPTR